MYFRSDMAKITLKVGDDPNAITYDDWKTFAGGDLVADNQKTRPGNMGEEVDIGGQASRSDITLTTQLTDVTAAWVTAIEDTVGVEDAFVGVQLLTRKKIATNQPKYGFNGTVKSVALSDFGGTGEAMITVVVSCNETAPTGA